MSKTVWRLQGSTDRLVECHVDQMPSMALALTVVLGPETFLRETYPDQASALRRAIQVRDRLLESGGWTLATELAVMRSGGHARGARSG